MEKENRRDLTVNGVGSASGGQYNHVKLEGVAKVNGDVDCLALSANGKTKIHGSVKAKTANIHGVSQIDGHLKSDKVAIHGKGRVGGNLTGEEIELNGIISIKGNCEAEVLKVHGGVRIDGLLNAGTIDIFLHGQCKAREIGGGIIRVRKISHPFAELLQLLFRPFRSKLTAETIEGDEIYLEHTKAITVRGNSVTIGPGCEIGLVEYKDRFQKHDKAKVNRHKRV